MMQRRSMRVAWLLGGLALLWQVAPADEDPSKTKVAQGTTDPADADLLEYLGSVDVEGQDWMDYLAHTDIAQVTKANKPADPPGDVNK
jgi:hypothetical protein